MRCESRTPHTSVRKEGKATTTWRLLCSDPLLSKDFNILPKKELHKSLQVTANTIKGSLRSDKPWTMSRTSEGAESIRPLQLRNQDGLVDLKGLSIDPYLGPNMEL